MKDYKQIITEQRAELSLILNRGWVPREMESRVDINSRLARIVTGVRRSGKSTLAHRCLDNIAYAYINFDDERLAGIIPDYLNLLLEAVYSVYGDFRHLVLDEIQNVDQWHLFVNRLLRNDIHIILTGSNSKLLSNELATHLTGRFSKIELFPFSFKEYLRSQKANPAIPVTAKDKGLLKGHLNNYMKTGGFPDILTGETNKDYVPNLFDSIVTRDIIYRYNLRYTRTFREIALYLTTCFSTEISYNRLKKIFDLGSENTVKNYIQYLEEAYLVACLQKFSFRKQESLRYRKIYLIDPAFATISGDGHSENLGRILENIVFLELARKRAANHFELFYYKKQYEVDFVIYSNRKVEELIQVCYDASDPKTFRRETRALLIAARELNADRLTIISFEEQGELIEEEKKIRMVPVLEWLLES